MKKIENKNGYDVKISGNGVDIMIPAFGTIMVNEVMYNNLPEGVVVVEENKQQMLLEIDPHTRNVHTSELLMENKQ